jgi:pimeloyl-ACP methyl ester carboxylesterase
LLGCHLSPRIGVQRFVMRLAPRRLFAADAGKQTVLASMAQVAAVDLRPCLARVTAPTLVVIGEKERSYLADARELAEGIEGAELRTITGAGHLWPQERAGEFVTMMTEWVAKASANG